MAKVELKGLYLGAQGGEFPDKETGELISWQRVHLWDPETNETLRLTPDRSVKDALPKMVAELTFGTPVAVGCTVSATKTGVSYRLLSIERSK